MSVIVQSAPYALRDGTGTTRRERSATWSSRRSTATRPGSPVWSTARQVITPLDLERDYGLTGGHPMHGEHGLDQFFLWRPLLGHARYRLPLDGLYLAGAGAHPGGGVTGQNGHNAAREIVGDLRTAPTLSDRRRTLRASPAAAPAAAEPVGQGAQPPRERIAEPRGVVDRTRSGLTMRGVRPGGGATSAHRRRPAVRPGSRASGGRRRAARWGSCGRASRGSRSGTMRIACE